MMKLGRICWSLILMVAMLSVANAAIAAPAKGKRPAVDFAGVFSDHMVMQRGQPITIWGTAPEGVEVEITFDGVSQTATADQENRWSTDFPARAEGGPYEVTLSSGTRRRRKTNTLSDILIGDVFLCSGQSNMEMKVKRVTSYPTEIHRKHEPTIRHYHPRYNISLKPRREFKEPQQWQIADKETVGEFSAACYFFARELHKTIEVPIGLLHSSWGGAQIQAFMSQESLRQFDGMDESLDILNLYAEDKDAGRAALGKQWENWYQKVSNGLTPWTTAAAEAGWTPIPEFEGWKYYGDSALEKYDGLVWYRNSVDLTAAQASKDGVVSLGKLSKGDIVWVNGHFVGRSVGWNPRSYDVPAEFLIPGTNHILINVRSMWGDGGMMGPVEKIGFTPDRGEMIAMPEGWTYKKEPTDYRMAPLIPWQTMTGYTGMHNGMIAPLEGLKFKAAIWYQGESNTRRADIYDDMLAAMIANWRTMFGANMPVVIVQLPDFGETPTEPKFSTWANLREAQRETALADPKVGLVVTLGLGDKADIHPTNKQDVGKRIANVYLGLIGETDANTLGHSPTKATRRWRKTIVEFDAPEGGFVTRSDDHPIAFELCEGTPSGRDEAPGKDDALECAYANAKMDGNNVILTSKKVRRPTHVRYCWAMAPTCNLFTEDGLPVGPFELAIK